MSGLTAEELAQRLDIHVDIVKKALVSLQSKGLVEIKNSIETKSKQLRKNHYHEYAYGTKAKY